MMTIGGSFFKDAKLKDEETGKCEYPREGAIKIKLQCILEEENNY